MPKYHFSVYSTVQKNAIFLGRCEIETAIYWNIQKYIEMLDFSEYQWISHPAYYCVGLLFAAKTALTHHEHH